MKSMNRYKDIVYWAMMAGLLFWFAYTKGWVLANFISMDAKTVLTLIENDNNVTILDVRTIPEYKEGHLVDATLIPLDKLEANIDKLEPVKDKKIIVYCNSGNRSVSASRILENYGFTPINVKGGIISLSTAGAQITK